MKSVLLGIGLMILVSIVAWLVLGADQETSAQANVSPNNTVRLD